MKGEEEGGCGGGRREKDVEGKGGKRRWKGKEEGGCGGRMREGDVEEEGGRCGLWMGRQLA